MVVMDPLAEPLSCPCVKGYAQRKYEKLAEFLSAKLGQPVQVTFAESFEKALAKDTCKVIDIAIGKDSVVRHDAKTARMTVTPIARLTGKDGMTTQHGLIVVRTADPAKQVEDLRGYRVLFGTKDCDEKFARRAIYLRKLVLNCQSRPNRKPPYLAAMALVKSSSGAIHSEPQQ